MKKGFTLIELLSVIVILAIIALIATPIVLSIINDSKESALLRSADFYIDALQNQIAVENMNLGGTFNPDKCEINETDKEMYCDGEKIEIKVDGEKPSGGNITFNNGKVIDATLTFGDKIITMNSNGELVLGEAVIRTLFELATTSIELGVESVHSCANSGICEAGTAFAIKVNDTETYKFYVISDDGLTINLIMSENLVDNVSWYDEMSLGLCEIYTEELDYDGDGVIEEEEGEYIWTVTTCPNDVTKGPLTSLNILKEKTANWINIEQYNYKLKDTNGVYTYFGEFVRNVRARMPRLTDIMNDQIGCIEYELACPSWISGDYWLTDTDTNQNPPWLYHVSSSGLVSPVDFSRKAGLRPVITLSK